MRPIDSDRLNALAEQLATLREQRNALEAKIAAYYEILDALGVDLPEEHIREPVRRRGRPRKSANGEGNLMRPGMKVTGDGPPAGSTIRSVITE